MSRPSRIVIFAKPPVPGRVNTRLIPAVGADGAAVLARAFLLDTLDAMRTLDWARVTVASTGPFETGLIPPSIPIWTQGEGDLGDRVERVLRRALHDAPVAMAVGVDSPGVPTAALARANRWLAAARGARAAMGPTADGGFYTLGLTECPEGILAGLPWSREDTLARTRDRLESRGFAVSMLARWFDVDRPEDLERLRRRLARGDIRADHTSRALETMTDGTTGAGRRGGRPSGH